MLIPVTLVAVLRCVIAFAVYVLLPGVIILSIIYGKERRLQVMEWFSLALGCSVVFNGMIAYAMQFVGGTLTHYSWGVILFDILGILVVFLCYSKGFFFKYLPRVNSHWILGLILVITLLWFWVIFENGPRLDYHDQWFHIAHIREVLETDSLVPPNPFWVDLPVSETFTLWHLILAGVARTGQVDTLVVWRVGNAFMAALSVMVIYFFTDLITRTPIVNFIATVVFLGSQVGSQQITRTFIYPWGISYLYMWLALGLLFCHLKEKGWQTIVLAGLFGLMPIFIHPQEFIFFCFALAVLGIGALLMRSLSARRLSYLKEIWLLLIVSVLIGLPLLIIQYPNRISLDLFESTSSGKQGESWGLYQHPLANVLAVVFPYGRKLESILYTLKTFNLVSLLLLWFLPKHLDSRIRWFIISLTCGSVLFTFFPGLSWLSQHVLRETYSWRLLNLIPTPLIWAVVIVEWLSIEKNSATSFRPEKAGILRHWAWIYFALAIVLIGVVLFALIIVIQRDDLQPTQSYVSPLRFRAMYEALDQAAPKPAVVLSDYRMSYAVPGLTKHRVVLNMPSHGSRDDLSIRAAESRALLSSPSQSSEEALAVLEKYGIDFILINKDWVDKQNTYSEYTLGFLRENVDCFESIYFDSNFEIFEFVGCDPEDFVSKNQKSEDSLPVIEYPLERRLSDRLSLAGFSLPEGPQPSQGGVQVDIYWYAEEPVTESYIVWMELLCEYPGRDLAYGRLFRELREKATGSVYQVDVFKVLFPPPSRLKSGEILSQSFDLSMPDNLVKKSCDLSVYIVSSDEMLHVLRALPFYIMEKQYVFPGAKIKSLN